MADMAENAPEELDQWFGTYNIGLQRDGSRWLITINNEVMDLVEFRDLQITWLFQVCCAFSEAMQSAQERAGIERLRRRTLKILKIPKSSLECWKSICFDIGCNRGIRGLFSRLIRGSGAMPMRPDDREKCKRLARYFLAKYQGNPQIGELGGCIDCNIRLTELRLLDGHKRGPDGGRNLMEVAAIISYVITGLLATVGGLAVFLFKQTTSELNRRLVSLETKMEGGHQQRTVIERQMSKLELDTTSLLADIRERLVRIETLLGKENGR